MIYYKAFDSNLRGWRGFQYEIGKEFTVEDPECPEDNWRWAHYSHSVEQCLRNFLRFDGIPRVCEVTPIGEIYKFDERFILHGHIYYTTHKIRIDRELSKEEIIDRLHRERAYARYIRKIRTGFTK